ncbi:hypothetical protein MLPF_0219 [Mycobacterium lepromatosis]|nr:hypothetical protein MLPF_0219 [Mycobacterium lepromatosis]
MNGWQTRREQRKCKRFHVLITMTAGTHERKLMPSTSNSITYVFRTGFQSRSNPLTVAMDSMPVRRAKPAMILPCCKDCTDCACDVCNTSDLLDIFDQKFAGKLWLVFSAT